MVTEISGTAPSHSTVVQMSAPRAAELLRPNQTGSASETVMPELSRDKQISSTAQVAGAFARLIGRQEALNNAAATVREVVDTAEQAERLLGKMEESLGGVVKMYPPYPIDNPERVSLLNSFAGLRRQIEALTFPPPESLDAVERMLKAQESARSDPDSGSLSALAVALNKEPMWDILSLDPESASDEEVGKALDQVQTMNAMLEDLQAGMWKDVVSFVKQVETSVEENAGLNVRDQLADVAAYQGGISQSGISRNAHQLEQAAETR